MLAHSINFQQYHNKTSSAITRKVHFEKMVKKVETVDFSEYDFDADFSKVNFVEQQNRKDLPYSTPSIPTFVKNSVKVGKEVFEATGVQFSKLNFEQRKSSELQVIREMCDILEKINKEYGFRFTDADYKYIIIYTLYFVNLFIN